MYFTRRREKDAIGPRDTESVGGETAGGIARKKYLENETKRQIWRWRDSEKKGKRAKVIAGQMLPSRDTERWLR